MDNFTAELQRWQDTRADYYSATKQALIGAGICKPEWFPEKLQPEFKKDGTPYLGNNGKQRFKRNYVVQGRETETVLTHRLCADGSEKWIVQIAVTDDERRHREEVENEKDERDRREHEERIRERRELDMRAREAARPTVLQLRRRYPDCAVDGEIVRRADGTRRQKLAFYARTLEVLVAHGLVTKEMLDVPEKGDSYRHGDLRGGGSFWLSTTTDEEGGMYWYVYLYTNEIPHERKHFPVKEARSLLKRIAEKV